jgi:hypothetical protein
MLIYDDTAATVLHAAADEARRLGENRYDTAHVLLGLLRTGDPVIQTVTADHPLLTADGARAVHGAPAMQAAEVDAVRPLVLAAMVPDGAPLPDWPTEVPAGAVRRLLDRLLRPGGRR